MILEAKINLTSDTKYLYRFNIIFYIDYSEYIVLCKTNVKLHPYILCINNKIVLYTDITNKTLIFHMKKREKKVEILLSKSTQKNRGDNAIEIPFCFIAISQLVSEI